MSLTRREFVCAAAGAAAFGVSAPHAASHAALQQAAADLKPPASPVAIASSNGLGAVARAVELIRGGMDPVDAVVAGVNLVEDDPDDHTVGLGGLPNEEGVVELDASVMHGPTHKAGAVAALRNIRNPSCVALQVMRRTDHVLLVGEGALRFARAHGFKEQDLLTDEAREIWLKWREQHSTEDDWLPPPEPEGREKTSAKATPPLRPDYGHGTINCLAVNTSGDLSGCTTTSGLAYKIPGRVGDSPILGAGLYVDNAVGAAGSTGRGEANLQNCSSFLAVELMRGGTPPEEACLQALRRVAAHTEPRLRNEKGEPSFNLQLYALRKDGTFGGASLRGKTKMAVHDGVEARLVELPALFSDK